MNIKGYEAALWLGAVIVFFITLVFGGNPVVAFGFIVAYTAVVIVRNLVGRDPENAEFYGKEFKLW